MWHTAFAEDRCGVAVRFGQSEDRPAGTEILVQLGGHAAAPAGAVKQQQDARLRHIMQRLLVRHLSAELDLRFQTALTNLGIQVAAAVVGSAQEAETPGGGDGRPFKLGKSVQQGSRISP